VRTPFATSDETETLEAPGGPTTTGGKFNGFVREVDFVDGAGIVYGTLERKFTAKRG
jgi:hypothetical protein